MIPSWKLIAGKEREPNLFLSNVYLQFMHRRWLPRILIAVGVITSYYWMTFIYIWESALIVEKISRVSWPFLAKVVLITILDSLVRTVENVRMSPAENPGKVSLLAKIWNCRYEVWGIHGGKIILLKHGHVRYH